MKLNALNSLAFATGTVTLLLSSVSSVSAYTIYTNRTAWEAALATNPSYKITTDTFSNPISSAQSITLDSGIVSTNSAPPTLPNPPFNNNSVSIVNSGVYDNASGTLTGASDTITWQFPATVLAFGADFSRIDELTLTGNFDGTGDQTISINPTIGGENGFLGIIGTAEFSSVIFANNTTAVDSFSIDNASFATKVPEPNAVVAFAILGGSLFLIKKAKGS
ncbi:MAG: PEP-CTERM sorting domain-containing protein [Microcystis sp. LE17-20D]|nr:PEP-CTERM sorting domain-containing protein [Microcystis sp. LE17-20D]MCZ8067418.1 PEP-CTERM sorting domain-containing protein [Microcystis sp. LE17-20D]MCZ8160231.1 PEP-CTERM sorting domain-containing protein [Microcystis sp. LE19-196.1B]MCZ8272297.1 PEP-CTERM sorting domain-containing protein [Microcystis sp. LE19-4.1E]